MEWQKKLFQIYRLTYNLHKSAHLFYLMNSNNILILLPFYLQ